MKRQDDDNRVEEMLARHLQREPAEFDFDRWAEKFPEEAKLAETGFRFAVVGIVTAVLYYCLLLLGA